MTEPSTFMDDLNDDIQASIDIAKEYLESLNNLAPDFTVPPQWTADMGAHMIKMYKNINEFNKAAQKITAAHDEHTKQAKLV